MARKQVQSGALESAASCGAAGEARALGAGAYRTYIEQSDCAAEMGDWERAAEYYVQAARAAPDGSGDQALALYNLAVALSYTNDRGSYNQALDLFEQSCKQSSAGPICSQLESQGRPGEGNIR